MQARAVTARCMKKSPAQTRHSLLASATVAPRSTAASAGFNPAAPLTAAMTQSAGRAAASMIALSPAPHSVPVPASASCRSPSRLGSAMAAKRAWNSFASFARSPTLLLAVNASIRYRSGAARSRSIVLSPIDPVAPRTVTVRTADAAALLLRKGTALIALPNHKTATDAIHAAPQKPENRGQNHCGDKTIETVEQAAMAGNDMAGVLDAEAPLDGGFEQIAKLRNNRKQRTQHEQWAGHAETERGKPRGNDQARGKAAERAGPGLPGTDARPEFRAANAAAGKITADIGPPYQQQDHQQRRKSPGLVEADQDRCHLRGGGIAKSSHGPTPNQRRKPRHGGETECQHHQRSIDPPPGEANAGNQERRRAWQGRADLHRTDNGQPFDVQADRSQRDQSNPQPATKICDRNGERRAHQRRNDSDQQVACGLLRRCRRRGFAFGHDPVFSARLPKRRSRL